MQGADEYTIRHEVIHRCEAALLGTNDVPDAIRGDLGALVALIKIEVARDREGVGSGGLGRPIELRRPLREFLEWATTDAGT